MTNIEIQFACPRCSRINHRVTEILYKPTDFIKCNYCKKNSRIASIHATFLMDDGDHL